jgi:MOSC domain-containing protein YiiM
MGVLEFVNIGRPRPIQRESGETTTTAIWKEPVGGRVAVRGVNIEGDDQADRSVHGGPDQAIYAYAAEDTEWWSEQLGRELGPGTWGENLTVRGLDVTNALVGERWAVGNVVLEATAPRLPCWKLARKMEDPLFVRRFAAAGRPGAYFRIVQEGELAAGDTIEVVTRPQHEVTIALIATVLLFEQERAHELLAAEALPADLREWAESRYSSTK